MAPVVSGDPVAASSFDAALRTQTKRSIGWMMARAAGDHLFAFLVFLVMARLLTKSELGTFAVAMVFVEVGQIVAGAGVIQLIARAKSLSASRLDTIFWSNLLLAGLYCAAVIALSHLAARQFDAPLLDDVMRWMALAVMLDAIGNTHMALRLREFGHSTLAMRSLLAGLLGGIAAAFAAFLGAGIWALVIQQCVREAIGALLAWGAFRWRPGFSFRLVQARENLSFSANLAGAQLAGVLTLRTQDIVIGKLIGTAAVSTYRVAWRCAELFGSAAISPFATVALQTFSRLQDNPADLRAAYSALLRHCAILSLPALIGYGIAGPWLVPSLFGPQWADSGQIASALMLLAIPFTVSRFVMALLSAQGRVKWQRQVAILELGSTIAVTVVTARYGLFWVALAYSARACLTLPVQLHLVRKASGISLKDHVVALWPPLLATLVMAAALLPLLLWLDSRNLPLLAVCCAGGAAVYATVIGLLLPAERRQLVQLLRARAFRLDRSGEH